MFKSILLISAFIFAFSTTQSVGASKPEPSVQLIQHLDETLPVSLILQIIEKEEKGKAIVISDFDDTLGMRTRDLLPPAEQRGKPMLLLRGGKETLAWLETLKERHIPLIIDTAGHITAIPVKAKTIGLADFIKLDKDYPSFEIADKATVVKGTEGEDEVYISGNVISGKEGRNKPHHIEVYLQVNKVSLGTLIFMDDSATNALAVYEYFLKRSPLINVIVIHVPNIGYPARGPYIKVLKAEKPTSEEIELARKVGFSEPSELENGLRIKDIVHSRTS